MRAVEVAGERVELLAERAAFWPARRTLLVADVHLGKPAAFGAAGVGVPGAVVHADLARLTSVLEITRAARLVVLGDLLHAATGRDEMTFGAVGAWRARHHGLGVVLVRGNHDRAAGDPPVEWRVECVEEGVRDGPFELRHEELSGAGGRPGYVLCGHVHPCVVVGGGVRGRVRARCFVVGARRMILPAFGTFTGGCAVRLRADDEAVLVGEGAGEMVVMGRRAGV